MQQHYSSGIPSTAVMVAAQRDALGLAIISFRREYEKVGRKASLWSHDTSPEDKFPNFQGLPGSFAPS